MVHLLGRVVSPVFVPGRAIIQTPMMMIIVALPAAVGGGNFSMLVFLDATAHE
jgi:hypothetical protein